jgi:hypothetical protein
LSESEELEEKVKFFVSDESVLALGLMSFYKLLINAVNLLDRLDSVTLIELKKYIDQRKLLPKNIC